MGGNRYEFDLRNFGFRKAGHRVTSALWRGLKFVLTVLSLTIVAYTAIALFYSTDEEKRLKEENSHYEELYPSLPPKVSRISRDLKALAATDDVIYKDIFRSEPPADDPMSSLDVFFGSDSIPDTKLVFYTAEKADRLMAAAPEVDSLFRAIVDILKDGSYVMPPMQMPLKDISYTQIGAGTGSKINPFYTTSAQHDGVDFIVAQGTPVFAPADGVVSDVHHSLKADGNTVTIRHKGGYTTRYAHLSDIYVSQGQSVRKGARIACAGMSGNSYAPHLHYEVRRDSTLLDPLNYIFASVTPEEYTNMEFMARHTRQSMD